ncbi:MAG: single-stranded DNA-binding protein [Spirochaetes bacterium]|nr:MAG: single-stranded DNA-binding protein [Spirochaetota bacterium]
MKTAPLLIKETARFLKELKKLSFTGKAAAVYNPLEYAGAPYTNYLKRFAEGGKTVFFLGMNPGPWGMAQTGIPFGEIQTVKEWMKIKGEILTPSTEHPKRPITGWDTARSEVSGRRLWGLFRERYGSPQKFSKDNFVGNYCPLVFMEESGRNLTPDKLPSQERTPLFEVCDRHLKTVVEILSPRYLIGVGKFAEKRLTAVFNESDYVISSIIHPSPANPAANRNWSGIVTETLSELGIWS